MSLTSDEMSDAMEAILRVCTKATVDQISTLLVGSYQAVCIETSVGMTPDGQAIHRIVSFSILIGKATQGMQGHSFIPGVK